MEQNRRSEATNFLSDLWGASVVEFQQFRLKGFTNIHQCMSQSLNECLTIGPAPTWLVDRRIRVVMKDKSKGPLVGNNCPIACLNLLSKLGMISDRYYI